MPLVTPTQLEQSFVAANNLVKFDKGGSHETFVDLDGKTKPTAAKLIADIEARATSAIDRATIFVDRGTWAAGVAYARRDLVAFGVLAYRAMVAHTSSSSFANDLAAGYWVIHQGLTAQDLDQPAAADMIQYEPGAPGSKVNSLQAKLAETPSIRERGAASDGVTNDGPAWTDVENDDAITEVFLPEGTSLTNGPGIRKRVRGPGAALLNGGFALPGTGSYLEKPWKRGILGPNVNLGNGTPTTIIFAGDSNTDGHSMSPLQKWTFLVQERAGRLMTTRQGTFLSGANLERPQAIPAGTVTEDTSGPLSNQRGAKRLAVGASLTITASWVDLIRFSYKREPGAGAITVTDVATGATVLGPVDCSGPGAGVVNSPFNAPVIKGRANRQYRFKNTGAGPVTINGIVATHLVPLGVHVPLFFMTQCRGGFTSADFAAPGVLEAILTQTVYQHKPLLVLNVGENDMDRVGANPLTGLPFAVSTAQYEANLSYIVPTWRAISGGGDVVLCVPLRNRFVPLSGEPREKFRQAVYRVAREFNCNVIDWSENDLHGAGLMLEDDVHMHPDGAQAGADLVFDKLKLSQITCEEFVEPLTPQSGASFVTTLGGVQLADGLVRMKREEVRFTGMLNVTGLAAPAALWRGSVYTAPTVRKFASVPMLDAFGNGTDEVATILMDPNGYAAIHRITGTGGAYIPLECIPGYNTFE